MTNSRATSIYRALLDFGTGTFYLAIIGALIVGWQLKEYRYISAENGVGYFLGIAGGAMMLSLLLYPACKRIRRMQWPGGVRFMFRLHMALGVIGPVIILFHANFGLGSTNSTVALASMLLVAGSGLVGRYLYVRIHQGLYGRRVALEDLKIAADKKRVALGPIVDLVPELSKHLQALRDTTWIKHDGLAALMLRERKIVASGRKIHRAICRLAQQSEPMTKQTRRSLRVLARNIQAYVDACQGVARFQVFDKLFGFWHIFHLPLFLMLVVTGLVHVFAVHIY